MFLGKFQMAVGMSGRAYVSDAGDNMRVLYYVSKIGNIPVAFYSFVQMLYLSL